MFSDRTILHGRGGGGVEIVAFEGAGGQGTRQESERLFARLAHDFLYGDPEARRALFAASRALRGAVQSPRHPLDPAFDPGSPGAVAYCEQLRSAVRSGSLRLRERVRRAVIVPLDLPSEEVLGPLSAPQSVAPPPTWIGLTLVDQTGTPVPGRPYRIVKPDGSILDGTLDSNGAAMVTGLDPGSCQVSCPYVAPHPAIPYTVQPGDHLSSIAARFGYDDFNTIWGDPANADLQAQRPDPHVLQPGDELMIPEWKETPGASKATGAKYPFNVKTSPLSLRLKLLDQTVKPKSGAQASVDGTAYTSDGDGIVQATIAKAAGSSLLDIPAGEWSLDVGGLNPADDTTDAGWRARLYNMGFLWDPGVQDDDGEMVIALQDFQAQYSLPVTGQLDDATRSQIATAHGC